MIEALTGAGKGTAPADQAASAPAEAPPVRSADYLQGVSDLHHALADEFMGAPQTMQGQMTLARVTKHVQRLVGGK